MLDENLPTFYYRQSSTNPLLTVLYFTQNGTEPLPEYSLKKADPTNPQSKNKYAVALADTASQDVIFSEVVIAPEWQQPTLSAAEIRAQGGVPPPPQPITPNSFIIQLYNPDQQVIVKSEKSTWTGRESWEFEIPQQSFRLPSTSLVDQEQDAPGPDTIAPKILMKWTRNSKFSKDITCYMTGRSVEGKKSKDPDITIAMVKFGREQLLTMYEPNLQRVDVEDRKGLELTLLLGAEVIREIFLFPNKDSFNITGPPGRQRVNSRPPQPAAGVVGVASTSPKPNNYTMSSAIGNAPPAQNSMPPATAQPPPAVGQQQSLPSRAKTGIPDPEAQRQQEREQRGREKEQREREKQQREREKRDRAEQRKIKKMLEEEEREEQRRAKAEVDKETERLRKEFGMEGQDIGGPSRQPTLPPRPGGSGAPAHSPNLQPSPAWGNVPPRPMSAEPRPGAHQGGRGLGGLLGKVVHPPAAPQVHFQEPSHAQAGPSTCNGRPGGRRRGRSADGAKIQKKKSGFFS